MLNSFAIYEIEAFHEGEVQMFFEKAAAAIRETSTCDDGISRNFAPVSAHTLKNTLSEIIDYYLAARLRDIANELSN